MIQPSSSKIAEDEVEGTDDVPGSSVPRKSTRTRKAKSYGSDFQLYLVEGTRDKTLSQREYCFIIEEDTRTLSEAMASSDVAFWKEAIQSEIDFIMHNNTWELTDLPSGCKALGCFRQKEGIDFFDTYALVARIYTIRLLLALAVIHDLVIHQMDVKTVFLNGDLDEEINMKQPEGLVMPGHESKLEYSRAIGCLMYAMISTRPDIAFAVGKLSRYTRNPSALHWQALGRVFQYLKGTMDYGMTYSGYPSVIEGFKETDLYYKFNHKWLRNLIYEIPLWPKLISIISIRCDSAATLAKAYSQVYNGKSRHLGVRHSKIRELIMNGVISVKFLKTQLNLADHLTKGVARDLVRKAAIGMGLKST
ncbi:zinc finger, CCHC-type containing protein [Tanacetum coccineum]